MFPSIIRTTWIAVRRGRQQARWGLVRGAFRPRSRESIDRDQRWRLARDIYG